MTDHGDCDGCGNKIIYRENYTLLHLYKRWRVRARLLLCHACTARIERCMLGLKTSGASELFGDSDGVVGSDIRT